MDTSPLTVLLGAWIIVVTVLAVFASQRWGASRNPLEWMPFFVLGPLMPAVIALVMILLIPISILAVFVAVILQPFRTFATVTPEGISMFRRIGGVQRVLQWSDIAQVIETQTYLGSYLETEMTTGERVTIPYCDESLRESSIMHGVPFTSECEDPDEAASQQE